MNPASFHRILITVVASFAANVLHVYEFVVLVKFHLKLNYPPHTVACHGAAQDAVRKLNVAIVQRGIHCGFPACLETEFSRRMQS
ncbi:MAG: hypothetical protein P8173_03925 [Gammaproteobacteria bacterium]